VAILLALGGGTGHGVAGQRPADDYLSEEAFPGLHILERVGGGPAYRVYPGGQRPSAAAGTGRESPLSVGATEAAGWASWGDARRSLELLLGIPQPEPYQDPWAIFDAQGRPLEDLASLGQAHVAFLLLIGRWMWPAVRVGFEQWAVDVNRESGAKLRTISLRPVVFEIQEFLSKSECEEVMHLASGQILTSSQGILQSSDIKKHTQHSSFRTSRQAWLENGLSPVVALLDQRVANLTRVPASHNEAAQLLRYDGGQYYHAHMDWAELELYPDQVSAWLGNHFGHQDRMATLFWYLNDVEHGGETVFPKHGQPICRPERLLGGRDTRACPQAPDPNMTSCDKGLKVFPRQGTVILWYNFHPSGRGDRNALHAGCPVGGGLTKWSANKWIRIKPLGPAAAWVDGHPALERHGWLGGAAPGAPARGSECRVTFASRYHGDADLMWEHPQTGAWTRLAVLPAGAALSQDSYLGHVFLLQSGDQRSNAVSCDEPGMEVVLSEAFQLVRQGQGEL